MCGIYVVYVCYKKIKKVKELRFFPVTLVTLVTSIKKGLIWPRILKEPIVCVTSSVTGFFF